MSSVTQTFESISSDIECQLQYTIRTQDIINNIIEIELIDSWIKTHTPSKSTCSTKNTYTVDSKQTAFVISSSPSNHNQTINPTSFTIIITNKVQTSQSKSIIEVYFDSKSFDSLSFFHQVEYDFDTVGTFDPKSSQSKLFSSNRSHSETRFRSITSSNSDFSRTFFNLDFLCSFSLTSSFNNRFQYSKSVKITKYKSTNSNREVQQLQSKPHFDSSSSRFELMASYEHSKNYQMRNNIWTKVKREKSLSTTHRFYFNRYEIENRAHNSIWCNLQLESSFEKTLFVMFYPLNIQSKEIWA